MIENRREAKRPRFNVYQRAFELHERITATLAAKITVIEKEAMMDRLKQAEMTVH